MGKALGSGNTGQLRRPHGVRHGRLTGDSQEGLNRRGARNLIHTYGGGYRGNTGQSDEVSTVRDTGQLIK